MSSDHLSELNKLHKWDYKMDRQKWLNGTLYQPEFEQDSCGFGLIAQMDNKPSHWLVKTAIESLACLTHRGAVAADGKSGDGCGLLFGKPDGFLRAVAIDANIQLSAEYAAGLVFYKSDKSLEELKKAVISVGLDYAGLRSVPVNPDACGQDALRTLPQIAQIFINSTDKMDGDAFERKLYTARRLAEKANANHDPDFYIPTLSSRVILYKGLVTPDNLPVFYTDLQDPRFESALVLFHQRFSTNTWPQWKLAQPFRYLAHNGEINTIMGNRLWAKAREATMHTPLLDMTAVRPIVQSDGSDSMSLDNMLEGLLMGGIDFFRALRLVVPPAWQNADSKDKELRAFYEFNSMHMESWDGPAGVVLTNGRYAGCMLDRNGLRPARYVITKDRILTISSEVGVWPYKPEDVVKKGRVKPGQIVAVDMHTGEFLLTRDIENRLKSAKPYREWVRRQAIRVESMPEGMCLPLYDKAKLPIYQKQFQLTFEERNQILLPLANQGQESVGSMGDDTPMAVLSRKVRSPFDYLRQQFAQVTNPPIDPIREANVMSLNTCFGSERNIFEEAENNAKRMEIRSPVLGHEKFYTLMHMDDQVEYKARTFDITYEVDKTSLKEAILMLQHQILNAVRNDKIIIINLSDRNIAKGRIPIHALFAVGAVNHALVNAGLRCHCNILVETATVRDPHHFACLLGFGATAIYPYLAYDTLQQLEDLGQLETSLAEACIHYRKGISKGLLKVLSKMGISTIASYRCAQLFEAIGINEEIIDLCMTGTVSRISGANFADFEADQLKLNKLAFNPMSPIQLGGLLKYMHGEEYHAYNPDVVTWLQKAVQQTDYQAYLQYASLVNERPVSMLRDLMKINLDGPEISIDEVEPIEAILKRFDSAGMSLGALSPEAHEALAEAMNRLGGRSNSGEGGEGHERYGTIKMSKIKQVSSGRFGVTANYLVNAEVLQIKVAQGAKPGEGGQLPGHKVSQLIATLRHSKPGISLISPPPHHDIYSIEDLAQLIFDLKQINPQALVSVKLVAEPGVGTIAAGVAKAYADLITISGYDGGTGASPLSSVKYAGSPWELGLSEAQQVLRANGLRGRVRMQTDGGLKTGLDVIKAAILGAESFGFGTGPMVALGCKFLRICHLNNCATGVATQEMKLRSKYFIGLPEMVMNYFQFVAQETREWMAKLGVRSLEELIGRMDLLALATGETDKQKRLDLSGLLSQGDIPDSEPRFCNTERNPSFDKGVLAEQMVSDAIAAIESKTPITLEYAIHNVNRSIGARLSGEIARRYGEEGLSPNSITVNFHGSAGQSFGVWNTPGLHLILEGDANDYVGKGMAGGEIVVYPPKNSSFVAEETVIIGNTCLYGATGGELYASGMAGERFAVRNSGASTVVEGVGDHGCEYMTGGNVIVLGETGSNFGAGMTGGFALVFDRQERFAYRYNNELIDIHPIGKEAMGLTRAFLKEKITKHVALTGSHIGQQILDDFDDYVNYFWLVKPKATTIESLLKD